MVDISRPFILQTHKNSDGMWLITINQQGRERYCEARLQKLSEVADWVETINNSGPLSRIHLSFTWKNLQSKKKVKTKKRQKEIRF